MKKLLSYLVLGVFLFSISCTNDPVSEPENNQIESLGLDYTIISEAYINAKTKQERNINAYGFHKQLETDMIEYLESKFPDKGYRESYKELLSSQKLEKISYSKFFNGRTGEIQDIRANIYDLQLSNPSESILIDLTYSFDNIIEDSQDEYVEEDAVDFINEELSEIKNSILSNSAIPNNEKQLLIEGMDAYSINIPLLLEEFSTNGTISGRWLRKFLRQVVTVVVNITVGVITGTVVSGGNPVGAIVGGVAGLGLGIYMLANNECYAFDRCYSGRRSCATGACL